MAMESKNQRNPVENGTFKIITFKRRTPDVKPNVLLLLFGRIETVALVDSGCSYVMIDESHYNLIVARHPFLRKYEKSTNLGERFLLAAGKTHPEITRTSVMEFSFAAQAKPRSRYRIAVLVTKDLTSQMIIGRSLLRDLSAIIDMTNNRIRVLEQSGKSRKQIIIPFYQNRTTLPKFRINDKWRSTTVSSVNENFEDNFDRFEYTTSNLEIREATPINTLHDEFDKKPKVEFKKVILQMVRKFVNTMYLGYYYCSTLYRRQQFVDTQ